MQAIPRKNSNSYFEVLHIDTVELEKGVYLIETKENKRTGEIYNVRTHISTLIEVVEKIKSESAIYYKVVYYDEEKVYSRYIKAGDLFSDGYKDSDDFKHILNNGLIISYKCKPFVIDYLKSSAQLLDSIQGTEKAGWSEDWEYIGNGLNTSEIIYTGTNAPAFEMKGNKAEYIKTMRDVFSENPLVFSIVSYCASGFLLKFLRNEINQILALTGVSSRGKSTVGKLALSLFTHPRYFKPMDGTKLGLSLVASSHRDNFAFFDESQESNMTPEQRKAFILSLANASERIRAQKQGESFGIKQQEEQFKYAILIAGNKSFLSGVNVGDTLGAIDTRFLEILLPESIPLWDSIKTPEQAEYLNQFIIDNHGHIAYDFVNYLKDNREQIIKDYNNTLAFVRGELGESNSIIMRKVRILAYTYETAKILAKFFDEDLAGEMAENAYQALKVALFAGNDEETIDNYKEQLSHIEQTQQYFFEILEDTDLNKKVRVDNGIKLKDCFGYIYKMKDKQEIAIISTRLSEFCEHMQFDEKLFLAYCQENKLLKHDSGKLTKKILANKVRARYYVLEIPYEFFELNKDKYKEFYQQNFDDNWTPWSEEPKDNK